MDNIFFGKKNFRIAYHNIQLDMQDCGVPRDVEFWIPQFFLLDKVHIAAALLFSLVLLGWYLFLVQKNSVSHTLYGKKRV